MKLIGIVGEYNPFHKGHLYHLQKIKEMYPDSLIILVLNGYFLERGEISIISKKNKTILALLYGVDIIVELPFVYGTQSADIFANAAVSILETLKCETIIFGSECNDINLLTKLASSQIDNPEYDALVKDYLNEGFNYPTALAKALNVNFDFNANDLLGISYIKSILKNNYHIKAECIKRTNDYLDTTSNEEIISASNIREKLNNNIDITKYVPKETTSFIEKLNLDNYFKTLKYKIITDDDLSIYLDVDEGIENRLKKVINDVNNMEELIEEIKTKRYTYNKIRRMLIHILIGFTKVDNDNLQMDYIRILGFNNRGKKYLHKIKKNTHLPLTVNRDSKIFKYEMKAALIYDMYSKSDAFLFEHSNKPIQF